MDSKILKASLEEPASEEGRDSSKEAFSSQAGSITITGSENVTAGRDIYTEHGINCSMANIKKLIVTGPGASNISTDTVQKKVKLFRLIEAPTPNFVGREDLIARIHSLLTACSTKLTWLERTAIIHGLGGMGKSEVARKYVQLHINEPIIQNVAWINAETKTSLEKSFQKIARKFQLETKELDAEEIAESVYEHFSDNFEAGLFIFDNVEQLRDQAPYFGIIKYLPIHMQDKLPLILITSRINEWEATKGQSNTVGISELGEDQAVQLLIAKLNLNENQKTDKSIQAAVQNLAQVIQGYPLGLTLAASNIHSSKFVSVAVEIEKYIERLNVPKSGWIHDELSAGSVSKYNLVMHNVWNATFEKIISMGVKGECALALLKIIAYLPTNDIEKSVVDEILKFGYSQIKDYLVDGYSYLEKFSLISLIEKEEGVFKKKKLVSVQVHRHVQRCTRERLDSVGDNSFLLSIGRYLCQDQVDKFELKESVQTLHSHLKQRKWPDNSFRLSIIFLSRYWDYYFALELATDLYEALQADVLVNAHVSESGYQTLLELFLYLVSDIKLSSNSKKNGNAVGKTDEDDEGSYALLKHWNNRYTGAFDASVEIFTSCLTPKDSFLGYDVCPEVQQQISEVMEEILDDQDDYKSCCIKIRDSLINALDGPTITPKDCGTIATIYKALNVYEADEINRNSALGLKAALQLHFQYYTNDSSFQNQEYWNKEPIKYDELNNAIIKSKNNRANPSIASDWENSIADTFLTHGGLKIVQQNLSCSDDCSYLWPLLGFNTYLAIEHNCSEALKKSPSFLYSLKERTATAFDWRKHRFLLLWMALFPPKSTFEDTEGRRFSVDSMNQEMETFLEFYWTKNECKRILNFKLHEDIIISALLPHLELSAPNMQEKLHFQTAVALMDGDIRDRKGKHELTKGWENVFKTRFNTQQNTPPEILDVGMTYGFI